MKKLLFIAVGLAFLFIGYRLLRKDSFGKFEIGKTSTIDFTFPNLANVEFSDREKADQARDWLLYTILSNAGLSQKNFAEATFDLAPIRYGFNNSLGNFEYGETRSRFIGDGKVVALIPVSDEHAKIDNLSHILDGIRKDQGEIPNKVYVFSYNLNVEGGFAKLTRLKDENGKSYFGKEMGYSEVNIKSIDDLKGFVGQVDDITYAHNDNGNLVLGGRKLFGQSYGKITIEDIAAIWQSEKSIQIKQEQEKNSTSQLDIQLKEASDLFDQKYNQGFENLKMDDGQSIAELPEDEQTKLSNYVMSVVEGKTDSAFYKTIYQSDKNVIDFIAATKANLALALNTRDSLRNIFYKNDELVSSSGFSLDPSLNYANAIKFVNKYKNIFENILKPNNYSVAQLLNNLNQENGDLFLYAIANNTGNATIDFILESEDCKYQKARYDGSLQGTSVGMTLFYTDLLAKIWAGNRFNSKPIDYISGFKDHEQSHFFISNAFLKETKSLPAVRLWFGPNKNGFQSSSDKTVLTFGRNSTQIFALGHDPGARESLNSSGRSKNIEQQASAEFDIALSWWNNHYEEVGRYEKQYERLNEIMKWSTLIVWLNNSGNTDLDGLTDVKVNHDFWFSNWATSNETLKFKEWKKVAFFPKGYLNTTTEAIPILYSPNGLIAGGVSLADNSLIKEAPELLSSEKVLLRRANIVQDLTDASSIKTVSETKVTLLGNDETKIFDISLKPKTGFKLRNNFGEVANTKFDWEIELDEAGGFISKSKFDDIPIGELLCKKTKENGFSVGFQSLDVDKGLYLAKNLSDTPDDPLIFFSHNPEVQRSVMTKDGKWCVQQKNSEKWMVMDLDAEATVDLPKGWQARISGNKEESRLINVKWVDENEVKGMVDGPLPHQNIMPDVPESIAKGVNNVNKFENAGEAEKAVSQINITISKFGETPELLKLKANLELKEALKLLENQKIDEAISYFNEVLTRNPSKVNSNDYLNNLNVLIDHSNISANSKTVLHNFTNMYFTDNQIFIRGDWEGYKALAREVPADVAFSKRGARFIFEDNASFAYIDPTIPFEETIGQIRSIPGAKFYDISSKAIGKNTRLYGMMDHKIDRFGRRYDEFKFKVSPGSLTNNCRDQNDENDKCSNEYSVRGPVYYITTKKS